MVLPGARPWVVQAMWMAVQWGTRKVNTRQGMRHCYESELILSVAQPEVWLPLKDCTRKNVDSTILTALKVWLCSANTSLPNCWHVFIHIHEYSWLDRHRVFTVLSSRAVNLNNQCIQLLQPKFWISMVIDYVYNLSCFFHLSYKNSNSANLR